jgi:hypothetical protein
VEDPPLLTHVEECHEGWVAEVLARYRATLSDERRRLLGRTEADWAAFSRTRGSAPGAGGRGASTNQRKGAEG